MILYITKIIGGRMEWPSFILRTRTRSNKKRRVKQMRPKAIKQHMRHIYDRRTLSPSWVAREAFRKVRKAIRKRIMGRASA
jgi:hypothetical protein